MIRIMIASSYIPFIPLLQGWGGPHKPLGDQGVFGLGVWSLGGAQASGLGFYSFVPDRRPFSKSKDANKTRRIKPVHGQQFL